MRKIVIDLAGMRTPEQIHPYIAAQMGLPDYYGKNLDALFDCLTEIAEPTCIGVYNMDVSQAYMLGLADVLRDADADNPNLCVIFAQQWLCDE